MAKTKQTNTRCFVRSELTSYIIHVTDKIIKSDCDTRSVKVKRSHYFCTKKQLLSLRVPFNEICKVFYSCKEERVINRDLFYSV